MITDGINNMFTDISNNFYKGCIVFSFLGIAVGKIIEVLFYKRLFSKYKYFKDPNKWIPFLIMLTGVILFLFGFLLHNIFVFPFSWFFTYGCLSLAGLALIPYSFFKEEKKRKRVTPERKKVTPI